MQVLKTINTFLESLDIPYEFLEWTSEVAYPYCVGEITEAEPVTEDGAENHAFVLTAFNRGKALALEEIKATIKNNLGVDGKRFATAEGSVDLFYAGSYYVPTGVMDLKRMQININAKAYKKG